jgi:hypothetical protein
MRFLMRWPDVGKETSVMVVCPICQATVRAPVSGVVMWRNVLDETWCGLYCTQCYHRIERRVEGVSEVLQAAGVPFVPPPFTDVDVRSALDKLESADDVIGLLEATDDTD